MSSTQMLQAKIASRKAAVKNLDEKLATEQRSVRLLRDQLAEHEVSMADRVAAGKDHERWTTWAEARLVGMQMQLADGERRIEKILETIVGHEAAIRDFKDQLENQDARPIYVAVSSAPETEAPRGFDQKVVADLDRKGPGKNPRRKYVAKGERKKSAEPKKAKKDKAAKNAKAEKKNKKRGAIAA